MLPEEDLTFPFGKDQFECLPFRTPDGFAAILLDLIEGFAANSNGTTAIFLRGNGLDSYNSIETVPQLVKRYQFFASKRREAEKVVLEPAYPPDFIGVSHAETSSEASPQEARETRKEAPPVPDVLTEGPSSFHGGEVNLHNIPKDPSVPPSAPKSFPFRVPSRA